MKEVQDEEHVLFLLSFLSCPVAPALLLNTHLRRTSAPVHSIHIRFTPYLRESG